MDKTAPVFPMGTVARLTGLSPRQIRYYDKLGLVSPFRTEGGHRLYSQQDVDDLMFVATLLAKRYSTAEIREAIKKRGRGRENPQNLRPVEEMDASFRFNSMSEPSSLFPLLKRPELLKRVPQQPPWPARQKNHLREDEEK